MIRMNNNDAVIIACIAQFSKIPKKNQDELLSELNDKQLKSLCKFIMHPALIDGKPDSEEAKVAKYFIKWVENNKANKEKRRRINESRIKK